MDKMDKREPFLDIYAHFTFPSSERGQIVRESSVRFVDGRVSRLLLVLRELEQSVAGLEELPQAELAELVSSAILTCGFVDKAEVSYAISAVLEAIETRHLMAEGPDRRSLDHRSPDFRSMDRAQQND